LVTAHVRFSPFVDGDEQLLLCSGFSHDTDDEREAFQHFRMLP
jgi:hypothetical protein